MKKAITRDEAHAARTEHRFVPGMGYIHLGAPPVPTTPLGSAASCEPLAVCADGSVHFLNPPAERGAPAMAMRWHSAKREWTPIHEGTGNRVGFTSEYLAAHGWRYMAQMAD